MRAAVREAGQKGCEITTSASASSFSSTETGPSLLEVTTSVWPCDSRYWRKPSSPDTEPRRRPGVKSIALGVGRVWPSGRSEEHTSELQSLMRISYAVFCLKKKNKHIEECNSRCTRIK